MDSNTEDKFKVNLKKIKSQKWKIMIDIEVEGYVTPHKNIFLCRGLTNEYFNC